MVPKDSAVASNITVFSVLEVAIAFAGVSQPTYPRVSFQASVLVSNADKQLQAVQADMRSNLTAHFAPSAVAITFSVLSSSGRRRLLEDKDRSSPKSSLESSKLGRVFQAAEPGG